MSHDEFEARIASALALARSEEDRFNARAAQATTPTRRIALGMKGASYNAVSVVLEEILDPGRHSPDMLPSPPFAPELAEAYRHPEEPTA